MAEGNGTTLGKAYVQILPSAKGITGSITKELKGESESAGKSAGNNIVASIKKIIATAGIGLAIKKTISEGMELEQNLGGAEAVFGQFSNTIQNLAKDAYKNMGMSESQYLQSANKMASLLKGNGMSTKDAMAMVTQSMQQAADVASVMGISTESAMEAINGAAKGNFTMMDNLGVAMNATTLNAYALEKGMEDFEFSRATNAEKTTLAMQMFIERTSNMTGNFARESAETMSGSIGAVKSAFQNLLGNLATGGEIQSSINGLVTYGIYAAENLGKAFVNILKALPGAFLTFVNELKSHVTESLPEMSEMVQSVINVIHEKLPLFLEKGVQMINSMVEGIAQNLPTILASINNVIANLIAYLVNNLPQFLAKGMEIVGSMANGLLQNIPTIVNAMLQGLVSLINKIIGYLPKFISSGIDIISKMVIGIIRAIPKINESINQIIYSIFKAFTSIHWVEIGVNLMQGIANGITRAVINVVNAAKNAAKRVWNSITGFFGIHSPSRLMAWAGEMLDAGMAQGIAGNTDIVDSAVDDLNKSVTTGITGQITSVIGTDSQITRSTASDTVSEINEIKAMLNSIAVVLDTGAVVGELTPEFDKSFGALAVRKAR